MYYVGVDGGGTHDRVCVLDESQTIIGIGKSGPSSIDTVEINQTIQAIESGLEDVFSQNSVKDKVIKSIFIGLGGVLTNQSKVLVKTQLLNSPYINEDTIIQIENDVYSAHLGGLRNNSGDCFYFRYG